MANYTQCSYFRGTPMISLNPTEYCNQCFSDQEPDIIQYRKNQFVIHNRLTQKNYAKLKEIVTEELKGKMNNEYKISGFTVPTDQCGRAIEFLNGLELKVHDLYEHIGKVFSGFSKNESTLGRSKFVSLPEGMEWQFLDPDTRLWSRIDVLINSNGNGANLKEGSVIKCRQKGMEKFFFVGGKGKELHEIEKRAAYNLASRTFTQRTAYWATHQVGNWGIGVIKLTSLRAVPDDIFNALARLRPVQKVIPQFLYFSLVDYELVKQFLKSIRIDLKKCKGFEVLPGDNGKASGSPLIPISGINSKKITTIRNLIESLGGRVTLQNDDHLEIKFENDSSIDFSIWFVERDENQTFAEYVVESQKFYIPLLAIDNIKTFSPIAKAIIHRAKKKADIKKLVCLCLEITNETDKQFLLDCIFTEIDDTEFITKIFSNKDKKSILVNWYNESVKGDETGEEWMNAPEGLWRKLSKLFANEVNQ